MDFDVATGLLKLGLEVWFFALVAVIGMKLLSGRIGMAGLLSAADGKGADPERVLVFGVTLFGAAWYAMLALDPEATRVVVDDVVKRQLPDVPSELLLILGGSQSTYITAKILR